MGSEADRPVPISRDPYSADRILNALIGARVVVVDRSAPQLFQEGCAARRRDQREMAHDHFVAAAHSARESNDIRSLGLAVTALADNVLHFYPDNATDVFRVREVFAEHGLELLRSVGDDSGVAQALRVRASIALGVAGREMLEESLQICRRIGDAEGVLFSLDRIGSHLTLFGDNVKANEYKRKALEMARVLGNPETIAEGLFSLAVGFEGSQTEHLAILEEAAMLYGRGLQKSAQARCWTLCAQLACDETDFTGRIGYLERAAQTAREAGDLSQYGNCLDILAGLYRELGNLAKAALLEQERSTLPSDDLPEELAAELTRAFSAEDPETTVSAVRKWFSGGTTGSSGT